jgi:enamine deaminase RidA (YjgF/YER057c/UK114 family)
MSITHIDSGIRMSQIVIHNDTVYLSGEVADDTSADMKGQTAEVLASIDRTLAQAGTSKENLLSAQIWLPDITEIADMNEVWDAWVVPGRPPVRVCVQSTLGNPDWKVEIMVIAALPENN